MMCPILSLFTCSCWPQLGHTHVNLMAFLNSNTATELTHTLLTRRVTIIIMAGIAVFYVAGYLIEERHRWPLITASHKDNVLNKFRISKERHVQMRKPYQSPGQDEKLILLYCPGRGLNSRPPAHRSFKHGQGFPRP